MSRKFEDLVAVVTGASSGIGAAVARELAREGARLVLLARRAERLEALAAEVEASGTEAIALGCDVTCRASLDAAMARAVAHFGGIDVVLANAGFGVSGDMARLETEDYRRQFETNVFGVIDTVYAALPHLQASRGRLGLVGSIMGHVGMPASAPYCASKFAVTGLAASIYYDLAERGVSVTLISPGLVSSEIRSVNNAGEYTGKADPAPAFLVMPVEQAARQIVRALYRRRPELVVTGHGKLVVFVQRHFPRTTRALFRLGTRGRMQRIEAAKRGQPDPR